MPFVKSHLLFSLTASLVLGATVHAQQLVLDPAVLPSAEGNWTATGGTRIPGMMSETTRTWADHNLSQPSYRLNVGEVSDFATSLPADLSPGRTDFGRLTSNANSKQTEVENLRYEAEVNTVTWLPSGRPTAIPETQGYAALLGCMATMGALLARRKRCNVHLC